MLTLINEGKAAGGALVAGVSFAGPQPEESGGSILGRLEGTGLAFHNVRIDFANAFGDLDLYLYDSTGQQIDSATGVWDNEQVSLAGLTAGVYFAKVIGVNGQTNGDYTLTIDAPWSTISGDYLEPNNTFETASDFRDI